MDRDGSGDPGSRASSRIYNNRLVRFLLIWLYFSRRVNLVRRSAEIPLFSFLAEKGDASKYG